jgi:hypothetical protein
MPTGYTSVVENGSVTDLRTFALTCARGMMALITMRDDPADAPIPERFEPSPYYADKLAEDRAALERLRAMTPPEREAAAEAAYQADCAGEAAYLEEKRIVRNRYNAMIAQVVAWDCEADGLKEMMLEQLHRGREFDAPEGGTYWKEPKRLTGQEWFEREEKRLYEATARSAAELEKEIQRVEGRNAWVARLRRSLDAIPASVDRSPEGQDAQRLGAEHESAVGEAETPTPITPSSTKESDQ